MVDDQIVQVDGYSILRQDRNTSSGGVILYIRSTLKASVLARSDTEAPGRPLQPEYLMCRVWSDSMPPVLVCLIYRSPQVPLNADPNFLANLRDLCSFYSHKVIMGDLNTDLLDSGSATKYVKSIFNELSLQIINHGATNHPPGFDIVRTWIDLICVDSNDSFLSFENKNPPIVPVITSLMLNLNCLYLNLLRKVLIIGNLIILLRRTPMEF